jgi:aminoglycoside 3-N-acetyltransferase I
VAFSGQEVIAGLTAHILPYVHRMNSEVYIYDLAVRSHYQRKGIGRKLLNSLKEYCLTLGIHDLFVQANSEDQPTIDFYASTGGKQTNVVQFSYKL